MFEEATFWRRQAGACWSRADKHTVEVRRAEAPCAYCFQGKVASNMRGTRLPKCASAASSSRCRGSATCRGKSKGIDQALADDTIPQRQESVQILHQAQRNSCLAPSVQEEPRSVESCEFRLGRLPEQACPAARHANTIPARENGTPFQLASANFSDRVCPRACPNHRRPRWRHGMNRPAEAQGR